jgi:hypothetical protein
MSEPLLTIYKEAQRASHLRLWSWPTLRVDDADIGPGVSSEPHFQAFTFRVVESLPCTIQEPGPEVVEHVFHGGNLRGSVLDGYSVGYALVAPGSSTCVAGLEYVPTAAPCTRVRGIGVLRRSPVQSSRKFAWARSNTGGGPGL